MNVMAWARAQWDRLLAGATLVAGVVVLFVGWRGVSGTPYPAAQLPYLISAGIGGLVLVGVATALWLSADLHDEWRKLEQIERAIRAADDRAALDAEPYREAWPELEKTNRLPAVAGDDAP